MEVSKSRRSGGRHRSPNMRRSRSRSPTFHRKRSDFGSNCDRSASPLLLSSKISPEPDKLSRKTDIPSSTFQVADQSFTDVGRFSSTHVNPPPITLTERFSRITASGTAVYNKRFSARSFGDTRHIPHLIITNNTQLPLATLLRQAKAISVVIDRKFPSGKKRPVEDRSLDDYLYIHRRPTEGLLPIFDRPEIKFYRSSSDEVQIAKRLIECVSNVSKSRISNSAGSVNTYCYDEVAVAVTNRFFGSRVEEFSSGANYYARPANPFDTPRHPSYFMHDDRDGSSGTVTDRRSWAGRPPNNPGYRPDLKNQRSGSRERSPQIYSHHRSLDSGRWQHDKFDEVEEEPNHNRTTKKHSRSVPKPVPAPKPMLWSTIGKEIGNGEEHASHQDDLDVQIDMEPVLTESIDES